MDVSGTILLVDARLRKLKVKEQVRADILKTLVDSFTPVLDGVENLELDKLIDLYSSEIIKLVTSNSQSEDICKQYINFAIKSIVNKFI